MPPVNSMDYSGKEVVLDVIRKESSDFFKLVDDPKNWNLQTRCTEWQVRDLVGHMIDVTEGYLMRWDKAHKNEVIGTAGLLVMSDQLNQYAQSFRTLPREQAIARLKTDYTKMMDTFEKLTPEEWNNFIVVHPFMGGLPTLFYTAFHVMDYGVHTWDIRYGLGEKTRKLDERTAGVLVPFMLYALLPSWMLLRPRVSMCSLASKLPASGAENGARPSRMANSKPNPKRVILKAATPSSPTIPPILSYPRFSASRVGPRAVTMR